MPAKWNRRIYLFAWDLRPTRCFSVRKICITLISSCVASHFESNLSCSSSSTTRFVWRQPTWRSRCRRRTPRWGTRRHAASKTTRWRIQAVRETPVLPGSFLPLFMVPNMHWNLNTILKAPFSVQGIRLLQFGIRHYPGRYWPHMAAGMRLVDHMGSLSSICYLNLQVQNPQHQIPEMTLLFLPKASTVASKSSLWLSMNFFSLAYFSKAVHKQMFYSFH